MTTSGSPSKFMQGKAPGSNLCVSPILGQIFTVFTPQVLSEGQPITTCLVALKSVLAIPAVLEDRKMTEISELQALLRSL